MATTGLGERDLPRKILVTGGAGFIGSHLCERLLARGDDVICADNFSTGNRANLATLASNPRFSVMGHDVAFPLRMEVDEIYNLACPASPEKYQQDPVQTMRTSVLGALNLLALARRTQARLLQSSTSEVYGDAAMHPQREEYWGNVNPIGPRACYDEGKRCAETLCLDYFRQYGVRVKVARIFNTYGPRMQPDDGRVVSNFIVQALAGQPITLYGDGAQTRSFCYVNDLVDGLIRFMDDTADDFCGPMNLGNPAEMTIRELAETVVDLTGSPSRIELRPLPVDDPRQRRPDISLARKVIDWQPQVALREGLRETIAWFSGRGSVRASPGRRAGTSLPVACRV